MAQQASDKMKNVHVKDCKQMTDPLPGQLGQAANMWNVAGAQSSLHQRLAFEFDRPNCAEKLMSGADPRARGQIFPRYCPRFTDQELQQFSGDSNSVITPLFEKMLSTSDVGRTGRLVLPKKCAEAHFPQISQPEGLPLKVQDSMGKEWVFQFRFWPKPPNKNSRMYALEGVTPCIQSMQLQAGDTVIFSRMDPEEKLLMGFRRASSAPSLTEQGIPIPIAAPTSRTSLGSHKRKGITPGTKSKEFVQVNLTWEAAQDLLQPPPNGASGVVLIDGHEIEEYEEPPIIGMPTILTTNQTGSSSSSAQELTVEELLSIKKRVTELS